MKLLWFEEGLEINEYVKVYIKYGKRVYYIVWLVLYLYENGVLLFKGVV